MKKYIYILILFLGLVTEGITQCSCTMLLTQDLTVQDSCCYYITADIDGGPPPSACNGVLFGSIIINTAITAYNPCEILSINGLNGYFGGTLGNNTTAEVKPLSGTWNLSGPTNVAEICFTNGVISPSLVLLDWEGYDSNGVLATNCPDGYEVKTCPSDPPLDCTCSIDYQSTNNNDCCYEIAVEFMGVDCPALNFTSVEFDSNINPPFSCNIKQIIAYPGYTASGVTNSNFGAITSLTNMANTSGPHLIGQICFENGNGPISVVQAFMTDNSGSMISCDLNLEVDASCTPPIPPTPLEKLIGDTLVNAPIKIIGGFDNKIAIITYTEEAGITRGAVMQIDLISHAIDFVTEGPDNSFFTDVALNGNTGELMIVGHTTPWYGADNKTFIIKIAADDSGTCDKIQYYDHIGYSEKFTKIIYHPDPTNSNGGQEDFYVLGTKKSNGSFETFLFKMDDNCNVEWLRDIPNASHDMSYGLVADPGAGVMITGDNGTQGEYLIVSKTGGFVQDGTLSSQHKIFNGYIFQTTGEKLLVGKNGSSTNGNAIVTLLSNTGSVLDSKEILDIEELKEVTKIGNLYYAVGKGHGNWLSGKPMILVFKVSGGSIIITDKYTIDDGATNFVSYSLGWNKNADYLLYTDGRNPVGNNADIDMFVAAWEHPLSTTDCFISLALNNQDNPISRTSPLIMLGSGSLPTPSQGLMCHEIEFYCNEFCVPAVVCEAKFTWEQIDCHKIQFTDVSTGTPAISYNWNFTGTSGQSTAQNPIWDFNVPGTYYVCLDIITSDGCMDQYCENVIVLPETVPPSILCSGDIIERIPACERGKVVNFQMPTAMDTCGNVTLVCSHQPGDWFPCGNTTVTCTATDDQGNTSICSFIVQIICECALTESSELVCSEIEDQYIFGFVVEDITGSNSCTANITLPNSIGNLTVVSRSWIGNKLYANGTIDAVACPFPSSISIQVDLSCTCPNGQIQDCTQYVNLVTPCCKIASMSPDGLCKESDEELIQIDFFGTVKDIIQIDYFVENGPCPVGSWNSIPYQSSLGYQPLKILPRYHTSDICITAIVYLGASELPCTILTTDTVSYTLCSPYDCSLNSQEYCYTGPPINPAPIVYSGILPDCAYTIEWYDFNGNNMNVPPNTLTIQPSPLIYNGIAKGCYKDFTYEMRIIGACGPSSCYATIRLWNDDAAVGDLYLDPVENLPLCNGDDASIRYDEQCSEPTKKWKWSESTDGTVFNPITSAGDGNPNYNTNRLYQDHWYQVERKNGLCPEKTVEIFIPVKNPFALTGFVANPYNACRDNGVKLNVNGTICTPSINAVCDCSFTIDWYKNGRLIGTNQSATTSSGYAYIDPALNGNYAGIYYAVVTDNCCGQVERSTTAIIRPPIKLGIVGPCYICVPGTVITLTGLVKNGPADGPCTYQWYYDGGGTFGYQIWGGGTNLSIMTVKPGRYKLEMTCGVGATLCTKVAEFEVMDCFPVAVEDNRIDNFDFTIAPNPSVENSSIIFDGIIGLDYNLTIYDNVGKVIFNQLLETKMTKMKIENLEAGVYFIKVSSPKGALTKKMIMF